MHQVSLDFYTLFMPLIALQTRASLTLRSFSVETHVPRYSKSLTSLSANAFCCYEGRLFRKNVIGQHLGLLCVWPEANLSTLHFHSGQELLCVPDLFREQADISVVQGCRGFQCLVDLQSILVKSNSCHLPKIASLGALTHTIIKKRKD